MSEPHEIIIVRRKRGDHDGHHGGVWKIAFADFMTAMMAFFLVLWIVNSTSKETRSSIARYFNPIKLSDSTPARKGLQDPRDSDFDASASIKPDVPNVVKAQTNTSGGTPAIGGILEDNTVPRVLERREPDATGGTQNAGNSGPEPTTKSQDPFELLRPKVERNSYGEASAMRQAEQAGTTLQPAPNGVLASEKPLRPASTDENPENIDARGQVQYAAARSQREPQAGTMIAAIQTILKQERDILSESNIQVREVAEGTLISLLDNNRNAMFQSGSAKLSSDASASLIRIAKAISKLPNGVIVSGYTDSAPHRFGRNNNWHLSAMRAEVALNVLLASGVEQQRIERIEGHADRNPHDPGGRAPQNRRIDILLRKTNG